MPKLADVEFFTIQKKLGGIVQYRYFESLKMCNEASTFPINPILFFAT